MMVGERIDMHAHFYGGGLEEALRRRHARPYLRRGEDGVERLVAMNAEFPFTPKYFDSSVCLAQMAAQGLTRRMLTFPAIVSISGGLGTRLPLRSRVSTIISARCMEIRTALCSGWLGCRSPMLRLRRRN